MRRAALMFVVAAFGLPGMARAELLTWTQKFRADFEFKLLANTPINPGGETDFIPFRAVGTLTFALDPSLNDPSEPTTVAFTGFTGSLEGTSPAAFLPFTISPDVQFLGGELTDIVRGPGGEVLSANVSELSAIWEMIGPGGIRLYTKVGLPFSGAIGGIPFGAGTVIAGPAEFEVFLDAGGNDPLVVIGRNRTLTAVPEPSSGVLLGLGAGALAVAGVARRRGATRGSA